MNPGSKLPLGNHCPGLSVTSCSHDDLLSQGNNFIAPGQAHRHLNSFSFCTDCYREWILNTFTHFWCFLELFIGKLILNINNEHAQDYSCPGATFAFCSRGEKLPWKSRLPGVVQRVTHLSKLPQGKEKFMWTVTDVRPCTEAKLTLGSVSCPEAMSCPAIMWTGPKRLFPASRGKVQEDKRKWNLSPAGNGPHLSDEGNPYIKTNLHTGCFRKIANKRGTQIASCAHIYMVFKHSLNWKSTMQCSPFLAIFWDTLYLSLIN